MLNFRTKCQSSISSELEAQIRATRTVPKRSSINHVLPLSSELSGAIELLQLQIFNQDSGSAIRVFLNSQLPAVSLDSEVLKTEQSFILLKQRFRHYNRINNDTTVMKPNRLPSWTGHESILNATVKQALETPAEGALQLFCEKGTLRSLRPTLYI